MGNLQIHISIQLLHGYMYIKKGFLEEKKDLHTINYNVGLSEGGNNLFYFMLKV